MTNPLLLLGGQGASTRIVYNHLARRFGAFPVIVEQPLPRSRLIRNRVRKLGLFRTLSQLAFMVAIRPLPSYAARSRLREIAEQYQLDDAPIPAEFLQEVPSVNADATIATILGTNESACS